MLLANFNRKEHLRHRAVSLRQHGFLVLIHNLYADNSHIFSLYPRTSDWCIIQLETACCTFYICCCLGMQLEPNLHWNSISIIAVYVIEIHQRYKTTDRRTDGRTDRWLNVAMPQMGRWFFLVLVWCKCIHFWAIITNTDFLGITPIFVLTYTVLAETLNTAQSMISFLLARRYANAGLCESNVCICPSVTRWYCIKTKKASVTISLHLQVAPRF